MAQARYWLWAASSLPIWALSCATKRVAGTGGSSVGGRVGLGSGCLGKLLLGDLLAVEPHQLALVDGVADGQGALLEHAQGAALATLLRHAALRLGELAHRQLDRGLDLGPCLLRLLLLLAHAGRVAEGKGSLTYRRPARGPTGSRPRSRP